MAKRLRPAENKASGLVFGLSVHVTHRRTGYPLPLVITDALEYLEKQCMDQVGGGFEQAVWQVVIRRKIFARCS